MVGEAVHLTDFFKWRYKGLTSRRIMYWMISSYAIAGMVNSLQGFPFYIQPPSFYSLIFFVSGIIGNMFLITICVGFYASIAYSIIAYSIITYKKPKEDSFSESNTKFDNIVRIQKSHFNFRLHGSNYKTEGVDDKEYAIEV